MYSRPVVPGGAGGAPDFGKSVNPISARGADYATTSLLAPPDFQIFLRPSKVHRKEKRKKIQGCRFFLCCSLVPSRFEIKFGHSNFED